MEDTNCEVGVGFDLQAGYTGKQSSILNKDCYRIILGVHQPTWEAKESEKGFDTIMKTTSSQKQQNLTKCCRLGITFAVNLQNF